MVTRSAEAFVHMSEVPRFVSCLMYLDEGDFSREYKDHTPAIILKKDGTKVTIPLLFMDTIEDLRNNVDELDKFVKKQESIRKRKRELKDAEAKGYEKGYDEGFQQGQQGKL